MQVPKILSSYFLLQFLTSLSTYSDLDVDSSPMATSSCFDDSYSLLIAEVTKISDNFKESRENKSYDKSEYEQPHSTHPTIRTTTANVYSVLGV
ncbi:hypothetical protein WR25_15293 [Diploscapter pachys]|uniref:Uncharacterized protein n=1 Tax=Diploscapter pachys TaxID=2018661 RepID=A0A2A2KFJ1_9BILA|nr:hypothetical protein WR25_15293 [Diploscapter pachys]